MPFLIFSLTSNFVWRRTWIEHGIDSGTFFLLCSHVELLLLLVGIIVLYILFCVGSGIEHIINTNLFLCFDIRRLLRGISVTYLIVYIFLLSINRSVCNNRLLLWMHLSLLSCEFLLNLKRRFGPAFLFSGHLAMIVIICYMLWHKSLTWQWRSRAELFTN